MKSVYCLYSMDNRRIIKYRNKIIEESQVDDFNISIFDLDNSSLEQAIESANSIPFLSDKRIVVMSNASFLGKLSRGDEKSKNEPVNLSRLEEYLSNPLSSTILIIECPKDALDSKKEAVKIIRDNKYDIELKIPDKPTIIKYIDDKVKEKNCFIKTDARDELIRRVSDDPMNFESEIEKLFLYMETSKKRVITKNIIQGLIVDSQSANIFELMNALLESNKKRALEIYYELIEENNEPLKILGFLINRFTQILYTKEMLRDRKITKEDIAKILQVSSGQAYYITKNAREIDYKKLSKCLNDLKELDYSTKVDFKYGSDEGLGFELFLLKQ